ncbi:hypothetical protein [Streptomyces sp. NPDC048639]|uniref:hypothetical protein n=1 Tax=Streptomyces sp. NPDC048639 TaxID=3365581 RepID=UPI003718B519
MMTNGKIAVALVGGYLLGRTKKAKLAIGLGMFLAGKKLSLDPQQLGKLLANSPALSGLSSQARQQLLDATKSAATTALTSRANSLAESLHQRTLSLRDVGGGNAADDDAADDDSAYDDDDAEHEDAGHEDDRGAARKKTRRAEHDEEPRRERESTPRRKAAAAPRPRKSTATSTAGKTASGGTRKAASGARKTASGTAKKAAKSRGSRNE